MNPKTLSPNCVEKKLTVNIIPAATNLEDNKYIKWLYNMNIL